MDGTGESPSGWPSGTPSQTPQWSLGFPLSANKDIINHFRSHPTAQKGHPGPCGRTTGGGQCSAEQHGHSGSMFTEATRMAPPGVVQCETCATLPCGPAAPWGFLPCH